jgi:DNA-binding protein YbaB
MRPDLAEQLERMLRASRQTRERLAEMNAPGREAQGTGASEDGLVTCTVSAGAGITDLTINPRAMERYRSDQLAATIREVITEANAQLRTAVVEQYREVLGESFDPQALADPDAAAEAIKNVSARLYGA